MTADQMSSLEVGLRTGLRRRAAGDTSLILDAIVQAVAISAQRRGWAVGGFGQRRFLLLAGLMLLTAALLGAAVVGVGLLRPGPGGTLMLADGARVLTVDQSTGARSVIFTCADPCRHIWDFDVSSDGRTIAFVAGGTISSGTEMPTDAWITERGTGVTRHLAGCMTDCFAPTALDLSPDGSQIALVLGGQVVVIDVRSGQRMVLPGTGLANEAFQSAEWSTDGTRLATVSTGYSFETSLTRGTTMTPTGAEQLRFFEAQSGSSTYLEAIAWSPDDSLIAFLNYTRPHEWAWVVPATGGEATVIGGGAGALPGCGSCSLSLAWSPDGNSLAVTTGDTLWDLPVDGTRGKSLGDAYGVTRWIGGH